MWKNLKSLVVSQSCYTCDRELTSQEECMCLHCLSQLSPTDFHLNPGQNELFLRFAGKVDLTGAFALYYFDKGGILQTAMKQLKYQSSPRVGTFLGGIIGKTMRASPWSRELETVIPVPLHRKKLRKRGYNQAAEVAKGIAHELNIPLQPEYIKRVKNTRTQTRMGRDERWENVKDAFVLQEPIYKNILLVDDVITTGATMEAILRTIRKSTDRPIKLYVACVGIARND